MSEQMRVSGHTLLFEGAPHIVTEDERVVRLWKAYGGVGGEGRGACSCGTVGPWLPSAYQRKKWHRAHKWAAVVGGPLLHRLSVSDPDRTRCNGRRPDERPTLAREYVAHPGAVA